MVRVACKMVGYDPVACLVGSFLVIGCAPCVPPTEAPLEHYDEWCELELPGMGTCPARQPRCSASDDCGPAPMNQFVGCYRPEKVRRPVIPQPNPRGHRLPKEANECSHDGECVVTACGQGCRNYRFGDPPNSLCEEVLRESKLLCGCVDSVCSVFEQ